MQCAAPRRRASSSRPGAVSCGCKTCHCARRQPYISRWTSEAAAVDLQPTVCPAVGPRWHWRAKKAKHKSAGNQPAGWTATSTARPAEVWKGARDALDCEEQQQRGAERKRQPHWTEEVATATLMAPLHSSSSRSDRAFLGIGSPARITATEPPWADPPQPAISSPVPETIRQEQDSPRSSGGRSNFASHVAVRWFRRPRYLNHQR